MLATGLSCGVTLFASEILCLRRSCAKVTLLHYGGHITGLPATFPLLGLFCVERPGESQEALEGKKCSVCFVLGVLVCFACVFCLVLCCSVFALCEL